MAIYPIIVPAPQVLSDIRQNANVAAWTDQATDALQAVNLSAEAGQCPPRPTSVTINIPPDERHKSAVTIRAGPEGNQTHGSRQIHTTCRPSEPMRRDSLKRRDAFLKGKEGSRQRRRWENGTLLHSR